MKLLQRSLLAITLLCASSQLAFSEPSGDLPTYDTGFSAASRIGVELYGALNKKYRPLVHVQPVALETDVAPFVKTVEYPDENQPLRLVFISIGFIDLMNNLAHAKAIDKLQPGYFEKYVLSLSHETGEMSLKDLPDISNKKFWSEDVMNEQKSDFNQMVGMVVAIELSHHYLGHFKKYADKAEVNGKAIPMNNLVTTSEWEESMKAGVRNALECGYGIDGLKALYDAINKMPTRPAWAAFFLPENVKVSKLKSDLDKIEKDFFQGK